MNIALDQEKSTLSEYINAPVGNNTKLINRTAVVRDLYARWCGRRGTVRFPPVPIMELKLKLSTQQIGKCGELLVQYQLLTYGIESAPMTTDSGIDLVAFSKIENKALTIQVKTNEKPKPGGGKGRLAIDWWIPSNSKAQIFAFVELSEQQIWIIKNEELESLSQQKPQGRFHFFMVMDPSAKDRKDNKKFRKFEFEQFKIENRIHELFI